MGDARLRALERRFLATRAVEDETAYLRERLRVGAVSPERVEMAAYLGHQPSLVALGEEAPDVLTADDLPGYRIPILQLSEGSLGYLAEVGAWWGQEFCMRFAIAAVIHAMEAHRRKRAHTDRVRQHLEVARVCLREAEEWVLADGLGRGVEVLTAVEGESNLAWACRGLSHLSSRLVGPPGWAEETMSCYLARTVVAATRIATSSRPAQTRERVALLRVARDEIVPWALETGDPIRDRHPVVAGRPR